MKILVSIDQKGAIAAGINAPQSTAHVEIDPATLGEAERLALAECVVDGHDASRRIRLLEPTAERLTEELQRLAAERLAEEQKRAARTAEVEAELRAAIDDYRSGASTEILTRSICAPDGIIRDGERGIATRGTLVRKLRSVTLWDTRPDPDLLAEYRAAERECRDSRPAAAELLDSALRESEEWLSYLAKRQAEEAQTEAERAELYARLPETLRQRDAEGYASQQEIERAMKRLILDDAGLGGWEFADHLSRYSDYEGWSRNALTDYEYQQLVAAREAAPGAELEGGRLSYYRRAEDEDALREIDDDGDVLDTSRGIRARVRRAGLLAEAFRPFD